MKKFALVLVLLVPLLSAGQTVDAGSVDAGVVQATLDAGVGVALEPMPASLEDPAPLAQAVFKSITTGNWWGVAAGLLVIIVALIRKYGAQLHELIPDNNPFDKVFWFFLETKAGCWLLNLLTAIAGVAGSALLAGQPITWALVKPVLLVSVTGAALWEAVKDLMAWFGKKAVAAPAPVVPPKA